LFCKITDQNIAVLVSDSCELGDNCIVFENFTASIGELMVEDWVYWRRVSGTSKRIFATIKSTIDAVKFSSTIQYNTIQLSPF
jgi:hypothetical protein